MTTQIPDVLILDGEKHKMASLPLEEYRRKRGVRLPTLPRNCSALWRGYIATWELCEGRLYLADINTTTFSEVDLKLKDFFPDCGTRVFARWFSSTLRVPQGEIIQYIHGGYCGGIHEQDLNLRFRRGMLVNREVVKNEPFVRRRRPPDEIDAASAN